MKALPVFGAPIDANSRLEVHSFVEDDGTERIELWHYKLTDAAGSRLGTELFTMNGSTACALGQAMFDASRVTGARRAVVKQRIEDQAKRSRGDR